MFRINLVSNGKWRTESHGNVFHSHCTMTNQMKGLRTIIQLKVDFKNFSFLPCSCIFRKVRYVWGHILYPHIQAICRTRAGRLLEPMSRSMQLHYIPITAFSWTDFLDRISLDWDFHGSAMTNHKKLIDFTGPEQNKRNGVLKIDHSVKLPWHRRSIGVACMFLLIGSWH